MRYMTIGLASVMLLAACSGGGSVDSTPPAASNEAVTSDGTRLTIHSYETRRASVTHQLVSIDLEACRETDGMRYLSAYLQMPNGIRYESGSIGERIRWPHDIPFVLDDCGRDDLQFRIPVGEEPEFLLFRLSDWEHYTTYKWALQ